MLLPHRGKTYLIRVLTSCDLGLLLSPGIQKASQAAYYTAVSYKGQSGDRRDKAGTNILRGIRNFSWGYMQTVPDLSLNSRMA